MIATREWIKSLLGKLNIGKYSTDEIRVGTWIDGKPIYRKVFEGNLPSSATVYSGSRYSFSVNFDCGGNVSELINVGGHVGFDTSSIIYPIGTYFNTATTSVMSTMCGVNLNTNDIYYTIVTASATQSVFASKPYKFVFEYTKITD